MYDVNEIARINAFVAQTNAEFYYRRAQNAEPSEVCWLQQRGANYSALARELMGIES